MLWFCQTRGLVCFPERIYIKRFSVTVSLKNLPANRRTCVQPGCMPPSTVPIGPEVQTFECAPTICRSTVPLCQLNLRASRFHTGICTCRILLIRVKCRPLLNCAEAGRIIEPAWILRSAVFYFCRASPYDGRGTSVPAVN